MSSRNRHCEIEFRTLSFQRFWTDEGIAILACTNEHKDVLKVLPKIDCKYVGFQNGSSQNMRDSIQERVKHLLGSFFSRGFSYLSNVELPTTKYKVQIFDR